MNPPLENGVRVPQDIEVKPKIDGEARLICHMAASLASGNSIGMTVQTAVKCAYSLLDEALKVQEERLKSSLDKEFKRRRGW